MRVFFSKEEDKIPQQTCSYRQCADLLWCQISMFNSLNICEHHVMHPVCCINSVKVAQSSTVDVSSSWSWFSRVVTVENPCVQTKPLRKTLKIAPSMIRFSRGSSKRSARLRTMCILVTSGPHLLYRKLKSWGMCHYEENITDYS